MVDDLLDVTQTTESLGKAANKDADMGKLTYPGLFGLDESKRMLAETRDRALAVAAELPRGGGLFPSLVHYFSDRDH